MKISIIITSYNVENYIEKCLDSMVNQTLEDIELIVVDDGSTDGTRDIIRRFSSKDGRIKPVLFEKNTIGGVATAANAGIDIAKGEYIGFADGDDWYETNMFELMYLSAEQTNADITICNYLEFDENSRDFIQPSDFKKWRDNWPEDRALTGLDDKRDVLRLISVPWRKIYKRSFLAEHGIRFPVGDYFYEDNPFHWECVASAKRISVVNQVLCYHRMNRQGQTMSATDLKLLAMYQHHRTIHDWLKKKNYLNLYRDQLITWLIGNTEWISMRLAGNDLGRLFDAYRASLLLENRSTALDIINRTPIGFRGKTMARAAVENNKPLFIKAAGNQLTESLWGKIARLHAQKGLKGLLATVLQSVIYRSRLPFHSKINAALSRPKKSRDAIILHEISKLSKEIQSVRAGLLFIYDELSKKGASDQKGAFQDINNSGVNKE